jgi:hypothetical protein
MIHSPSAAESVQLHRKQSGAIPDRHKSSCPGKHFDPNTHTSAAQHPHQTFDREFTNLAILECCDDFARFSDALS